ncbi:HNH endonuclease [Aeromonas jandaei]|uniref:HNH endonuclease signature motif containing protein n=1 Tax=Aeromonas jandaei TaxID=650 RepID=UPI001F3DF033|nr:HNH endonuclease signature motif containing protein [Aeromonas jandaei]MCF7718019.1 HNH endonuclease [Aeromonas jandaei]
MQIHHIDQNPANNVENNLVALCGSCHDEAHTHRSLSKNLTSTKIKDIKSKWEKEVKERSSKAMLPGNNIYQAMWTFVNHQRLPDLMRQLGVKFDSYQHKALMSDGVIDRDGNLKFQVDAPHTKLHYTIYDHFRWDYSQRIHSLFTQAVDKLIMKASPIELGAIWSKTEIRSLVVPGSICHCIRGFIFKREPLIDGVEHRQVFARSKNIEVRFSLSSFHIYGTSAYVGHFVGSHRVSALFMVKDVFSEGKTLVILATPLALGSGFLTSNYSSPYPLKYAWAQ